MSLKRERARLCWSPQWEGLVQGWTKKFIYLNKWRCDFIHDPEDLLQDAYLTYVKIRDMYPRVMTEANFMSLYKRAIINKTHDSALYMKRKNLLHVETSEDVSDLYTGRIGELTNAGYASVLLSEAPEELRLALRLLAENPEALRTLPKTKKRTNLNSKLRELLGVGHNFDFAGELKALLSAG